MEKSFFFKQLRDLLEIKNIELNENTNLKELEEFDSMSMLTIAAFVENNFNKKIPPIKLTEISTISSLMEIIGMENFK